MSHILHLTQQLSRGGAGRALLTLSRKMSSLYGDQHVIVSLIRPDPMMKSMAEEYGASVVAEPDVGRLFEIIEKADLVHVHFWNTPELYAVLNLELPLCRLLIWSHVVGDRAPHIITPALQALADCLVVSCPNSLLIPAIGNAASKVEHSVELVPAPLDTSRLECDEQLPHDGLRVGYIGTVDYVKMHSDFVALHATLDIPYCKIVVVGEGSAESNIRSQVMALGIESRFEFLSSTEDIGVLLRGLDVFSYPLAEYSSAASELILQEAMYLGVPPVVLNHGTPSSMIEHRVSGWIANNAREFTEGIRYLLDHPEERQCMGRRAREKIRKNLSQEPPWQSMQAVYSRLLDRPRRTPSGRSRRAEDQTLQSGALKMISSFGTEASAFITSINGPAVENVLEAERIIAESSPILCSPGGGGVLHYRRFYDQDPYLQLWSGLIFHAQDRPALAIAEFHGAMKLGLIHWRLNWYMARSAWSAGSMLLAQRSIGNVLAEAPDFKPALDLAEELAGV